VQRQHTRGEVAVKLADFGLARRSSAVALCPRVAGHPGTWPRRWSGRC